MTTGPDLPKDQSPSTLADRLEYAIATASNDDYTLPGTIERQRHCDRLEAMRDAMEYLRGAALRSPTREAARSEALREAADAADDEACASCRGCKTFSTRILALQDRATSGTTGRPDPGQGELNYYRAEGTGDTICIRCEFNLSTYLRERIDAAVRAERERGDALLAAALRSFK